MKKVATDSLASIGAAASGNMVQNVLPPPSNAITTGLHIVVAISTAFGAAWPVIRSVLDYFKKRKNEKV